jgi:transglutaminase-like putative cysteine protease
MSKLVLVVLLFKTGLCFAADTAPDWVMEQSSRSIPTYSKEVGSAVLLDEGCITVEPDGTMHRSLRYVVRVLSVDGRNATVAALPYFQRFTKIKDFHAWLVAPGGAVKAYGKESIEDVSEREDFELYSDTRVRVIRAHNAENGATFAWTATIDEGAMLLQDQWRFQGEQPVLLSRYVLTLPSGWEAKGEVFNLPSLRPTVEGTTYNWEARNLPFIKSEPASPGFESVSPWLGVSFYPTQGGAGGKVVKNWSDVSLWQCHLADAQADVDDRMVAKVRELTANAASPYAKIQAIAHYVQQIKYVAIETNLARGGGYQPHPATQVFDKQYGDCKDKANLMHALLKIAGIDSYLVAIFSGDRDFVHPEWAAPGQFNHMIIAIKVGADVNAPAVLVHAVLGRLLMFDSTSTLTPMGELPEDEQSSYALILAGQGGDLVKMPLAPDEANRMAVEIAATLTETGALDATVAISSHGESASRLRGVFTHFAPDQLQRRLDQWISETTKQNTLAHVEPKDDFDRDQFALNMAFTAPAYGQVMQRRMLVFRPSVLARFDNFRTQSEPRLLPIVLKPQCYHEQVHIKLPAGFQVDEIPDAANISTSFGKYTSSYKVDGAELVFTEDLDVAPSTLPAENYTEVKGFFQHVAGAEQAPLLLLKN